MMVPSCALSAACFITFLSGLFISWTPANWIAFTTAGVSLALGVYNNRAAASREKIKNKREEFHRRIAVPLEGALDQFSIVQDELYSWKSTVGGVQFDTVAIENNASAAQRSLSRYLRFAAGSPTCSDEGWDLASDDYDSFVELLDRARNSNGDARRDAIQAAIDALERQDAAVRKKIESELAAYIK